MNEIIRFDQPSFSLQVEEKDTVYTIEVGRNESKDAAFRVNKEKLKYPIGDHLYEYIGRRRDLSMHKVTSCTCS